MIEDFGVPVPGEAILIAAAVYAGAGRLNVLAVGVIGFVAAVVGDNIGFAIGHYGGRALVLRWGRYVRLTGERLDKAEIFFQRHGAWIITIAASSKCYARPTGSSPAPPGCGGGGSWRSTPSAPRCGSGPG
jgi:membrane protein DedA with SNARE-associated domain